MNTRAEGLQIDRTFPILDAHMVSCSCKDSVSTQVVRDTKGQQQSQSTMEVSTWKLRQG